MLQRLAQFVVGARLWVVGAIAISTIVLAGFASRIEVRTEFSDLLPQGHEYVAVDSQYKASFGSSNMVTIMVEVKEGTIFTTPTLEKVRRISRALQTVKGVNQFQVVSLASKKLKEVRSSTEEIATRPLMWPDVPNTTEDLEQLRLSVINSPLIYGKYVSEDLRSTVITVDFHEHLVDFQAIFDQINTIVEPERDGSVDIHIVGEPVLYGWIRHFLPETLGIFLATMAILAAILFVSSRSLRGTLVPVLAGVVSAIWALGIAQLMGYSFDPLVVVVAFLISARSISHSVQVVSYFEYEVNERGKNAIEAAKASVSELFKPGTLGVITDAGGILVVALTPIPLLHKVAIIGCIWVLTISLTSVFLTPALLSWVRRPDKFTLRLDLTGYLNWLLDRMAALGIGRHRKLVIGVSAMLFVATSIHAFNLTIGDAHPGSPILWPDSVYNESSAAINAKFPGADRMFLVVSGEQTDDIKRGEVLESMQAMQRFLESQPEIGGTVSIADIVPMMNRIVREGNPRYDELGADAAANGEMLYLFTAGSEPGDLDLYVDTQYQNASITAFFHDRRGETVRTAIGRIKTYLAEHQVEGVVYKLAGGVVGMIAAVNEIILAGQIEAIALALLVVVLTCTVTYRTTVAGMFFMVPVLLSNAVTFSFMTYMGIGMSINTVPVAALGIGLGVDYSFYIVDRIKEELERTGDIGEAVRGAMRSAGRAVLITGLTLCISVLTWTYSSLKFQAEMGLLMGLWLFVSALSALVLMPALVVVLKPRFVVGDHLRRRDETAVTGRAGEVSARAA